MTFQMVMQIVVQICWIVDDLYDAPTLSIFVKWALLYLT
jgi:hypothetical protein